MQMVVSLDKAAFLVLQGAKVIGFEGKYFRNCKVVVETEQCHLDLAKKGLVKYQNYMKTRHKLKQKIRKAYGQFYDK